MKNNIINPNYLMAMTVDEMFNDGLLSLEEFDELFPIYWDKYVESRYEEIDNGKYIT